MFHEYQTAVTPFWHATLMNSHYQPDLSKHGIIASARHGTWLMSTIVNIMSRPGLENTSKSPSLKTIARRFEAEFRERFLRWLEIGKL